MGKKFDVYGLGNALVDLQVRVQESDLEVHKLTKGGMQLVSSADQAVLLEYFEKHAIHHASGGSVANSIIAVAQLGGKGAYGCVVGDDNLGKFYQQEMADLGIALHNSRVKSESTGSCFILITPDAERTMNTTLAASALFGPEHVSAEFIKDAEWVLIEGYLLSAPTGQAAALKAAEVAVQVGTKVAVSFSDTFIVTSFGDALRAVVSRADLLIANHVEAQAFTGVEDEEQRFQAFKKVAPNVVMTMHERGARVAINREEHFIEPFPVRAIDTTGAGDMFAGSLLFGLTHGYSVPDAGKLACFLASRVVAQLGPRLPGSVREIVGVEQVLHG